MAPAGLLAVMVRPGLLALQVLWDHKVRKGIKEIRAILALAEELPLSALMRATYLRWAQTLGYLFLLLLVRKALKVSKVSKVFRAYLDLKGIKAIQEMLALKDCRASKAFKVLLG
jgi:hypothetical protein